MIYLKQFMLATPKLHVTKQCNQENNVKQRMDLVKFAENRLKRGTCM